MKLSEIKGDKAFDVIEKLIEPIAKIAGDKRVMNDFRTKPKLIVAKNIVKNHRSSIVEVLAALDFKTPEEYMETVTLLSLPKQIIELFNDPEIIELFESQSQTEKTSFGSVTENTEAKEN